MKTGFGAALICALMATTPVLAQSGATGVFTIVNDTEGHTLTGFYTSEDGNAFSDNWLSEPLEPGDSAEATFEADTGACTQYFIAGWLSDGGGEVEDDVTEIDICAASVVYLGDNEITFE